MQVLVRKRGANIERRCLQRRAAITFGSRKGPRPFLDPYPRRTRRKGLPAKPPCTLEPIRNQTDWISDQLGAKAFVQPSSGDTSASDSQIKYMGNFMTNKLIARTFS